jgi:2-haloacid dehalogenase
MVDLSKIKALTFDVGGTVFDWRGTIEEELRQLASNQNADLDIPQFATDWRRGMFQMLGRVRAGELPWMNADQLHRSVLDDVLTKHTAIELSESGREDLNNVWHRLNAWPDAPAVIEKLRSRYTVVVLTVLSWSIAVDCSKHNGISWDGILSCEFLGHYKPDAEAYHKGVSLLRLEPEQAMMVAAHPGDLNAAIKAGLHSAYVHREGESAGIFGEVDSEVKWDVNTRDFAELESQLLD